MVADRQTQRLPEDDEGLARIATFLGFDDQQSFAAALTRHLNRVEQHYAQMFEREAAAELGEEEIQAEGSL
ncbi:hypothetical protein LTR94_038203, partial [Friedmanniomyces endolithicus]